MLDVDIYEVDPSKTGMVPRDFLLYCYYGGMIYVGEKRFNRAMAFFMNVSGHAAARKPPAALPRLPATPPVATAGLGRDARGGKKACFVG